MNAMQTFSLVHCYYLAIKNISLERWRLVLTLLASTYYLISNAPLIFITFNDITNKTFFYQSHLFLSYMFAYVLCFITAFSDSKLII